MKQIHGGDVYRHPDAIDFSSNMNPLGTPASVIEAAQNSMLQIRDYPDIFQEKLIRALSDFEKVPKDWLICGNGAAELIFSLVYAIKPKKAMVQAPGFAEYEQAILASGSKLVYYFLKEEQDFLLDEGILQEITEDIDLLILCNPNNPTGQMIPQELLLKICEKCQKTGTVLMVDECFQDFVENEESHSLKNKAEAFQNLFLLKAFTKRYAMAGIRLGYGITANPELIEKMHRVMQPWNVSIPAQAAGVAALGERAYLEEAQKLVASERDRMKKAFAALSLKVYGSYANYIFFRGPADLPEKLLEKNILIRDCSNYPGLKKGYFRVAVRTAEENDLLLTALQSIL